MRTLFFNHIRETIALLVVLVVCFTLIHFGPSCQHVSKGGAADEHAWRPKLHFRTPEGKWTNLSEYKGKAILLNFWAYWCGPCLAEMPELSALERKLDSRKFAVLAVHLEAGIPETERNFISGITFPHGTIYEVDRKDLDAFPLDSIPLTLLIDADGQVRKTFIGPEEWTSDPVFSQLKEWLPH